MKSLFFILVFATFSCFATNTNLDYAAIAAQEDAPNMILSEETNFLKSGVWINNSNHVLVVKNGKMITHASLAMINMSTNTINFWWFNPSSDLQYQIKLVDDKGNEIQKTTYGKRFGRIPKKNPDNMPAMSMQNYGLQMAGVLANGDSMFGGGDYDPVTFLPQCFEMKAPGNYKLTLIHHIYVTERRANEVIIKPINFSPVVIDVRVEKQITD